MTTPTDQRQPDELDALLQKVEEDSVLNPAAPTKTHKKSVSLFASTPPLGSMPRRRHRKNKSSLSDMYHAIKEYPIREDFQNVSDELKRHFVHDLEDMDRGKVGFFDMNMTRSLSVLPEDIADLAKENSRRTLETTAEEDEEKSTSANNTDLFHYGALFLAVFAVSSKSTAFHMLDPVPAALKQYWKMAATSVGLLPLFIRQYRKHGLPTLSPVLWATFVAAIICYSVQGILFVKALEYTTVGNACIYANSQALLLIIGKAVIGESIHWMEGLGVVMAFAGAILCTQDAEAQSSKDFDIDTNGKLGDGLALLAAVAGVSYLTFAKAVRTTGVSVTTFVFGVMLFGQFFILAFLQMTDKNLEYSLNQDHGVFGWLNWQRLPVMIYMVAVVNFVGTMGFVRAMATFDTVVIAVATLMEPLMASVIAYICHAGLLPGPLGWLGNLLVVIGTLGVVYPSVGKNNSAMAH